MAYWVNHLLHKCEDLSLYPQQVWQPAYDQPQCSGGSDRILGTS